MSVRQPPEESFLEELKQLRTKIGELEQSKAKYTRMEEALRETEARFRTFADAMPLIVWTARPDGYVDYFNQRWMDYTGLTFEQSLGWGWQPVLHPDDLQPCLDRWEESVREDKPYEIQYRFKRAKDGVYRWHLGRALPIKNEQGQIASWIGTCTDIDTQKRVEERTRFLGEGSTILSSSLEYEVTLASLARLVVPGLADWCSVTILENGETRTLAVQHKDPAKIAWAQELERRFPPDPNAPTGVPNVLRTGCSEIYPVITDEILEDSIKNQEQLEIARQVGFSSVMIVPLTARERTLGTISFVSAESKRYYDESDLALAEELAQRAAIAIDNARLYREAQQAVEAQKELSYLKDLFLSIATHELRTPLTSIKGYNQMVQRALLKQRDELPDPTTLDKNLRSLDSVARQVDRMSGLIDQLLDFSRLQNQQFELNYSPDLNLIELVQRVVEQHRASTIDHSLLTQLPDKPIIGDWDEARLEQVLNNLISNALKYSQSGTSVTIGVEHWAQGHPKGSGQDEAVVWVKDEGNGISEEHQAHIFSRFYRVRNENSPRVDGLGLGLYISHEFITQHGGKMWVESKPGEGSTFYFSLPLKGERERVDI